MSRCLILSLWTLLFTDLWFLLFCCSCAAFIVFWSGFWLRGMKGAGELLGKLSCSTTVLLPKLELLLLLTTSSAMKVRQDATLPERVPNINTTLLSVFTSKEYLLFWNLTHEINKNQSFEILDIKNSNIVTVFLPWCGAKRGVPRGKVHHVVRESTFI